MSKIMEDLSVYESRFNFVTEDKPKAAANPATTKGKSRISGRKALANISNTRQVFTALKQDKKSESILDVLRKSNEQLQKDKTALLKQVSDKNKVIELSGNEIQKLRVTLEKLKQQNSQLVQSNSQMQAELNSANEKLKVLNHELECKKVLIIAKNLELEEKDKIIMCQAHDSDHNKVTEPEEKEVCNVAEGDDDNQISKSLVHSNNRIQDNDKGKSKRLQKRRQSARFKLDEPKPTQDSLKMNNIDDISPRILPDYNAAADGGGDDDVGGDDDIPKVNDSNAGTSSAKKEDAKENYFQDENKHQEHKKSSLSRPVREAAKKVQSYKEVNLVVKMRRE